MKKFNYEDRLVEFAALAVIFTRSLDNSIEMVYYRDQLVRSTGSAALNYGEAQGTQTTKDFIHKASLVAKELKETRVCFKILARLYPEKQKQLEPLLVEVEELIAIVSKMIYNKKQHL